MANPKSALRGNSPSSWRLVCCAAAPLVQAILIGCNSVLDGSPPSGRGPIVQWSKPVNGLSLGIEVPQSPFSFVATQDWTSGTWKPGGFWDDGALVTAFIRNETDQTIYWSRDAWSVTLTAPDMEEPKPWPGPIPFFPYDPPIALAPRAVDSISLHLGRDFSVWPRLSSGRYWVHVTYAPTHLLTYAHGGVERDSWVHPFDIPGFWTGTITTPTIAVQVDAEPHALSGKQQVTTPS